MNTFWSLPSLNKFDASQIIQAPTFADSTLFPLTGYNLTYK
jgi:hypothetical protein